MKFPLWPLSIGLPIMRSVNGRATSHSYVGADSQASTTRKQASSPFLTGKPCLCYTTIKLLNVEQCPCLSGLTHMLYIHTYMQARTGGHTNINTHTEADLLPTRAAYSLPVLFLFFHSPTLLSLWPGSCGRDTHDKVSLY